MHLTEPWLRFAHRQGCSVVTLIPVRRGDVEHGIALVVLHGERDVAQRAGWFPAVAPPVHRINVVMARAFSFHVVVVVGASGAPVLHHLEERWPKLPSPLNAMRNSLGESSIVAHCGVDAPLRGEPTKMVPSLPLLRDAQATKVIGDELKVPNVNWFTEEESTAW
jgi:hypothetical protein